MEQSIKKLIWLEGWRPLLLSLALLQGWLLLGTERDRLQEIRTLERRMSARSGVDVYNRALDPGPARRLPRLELTAASGASRTIPPLAAKRAVMLFVGACTPCVVDKLQLWQQAATPERPVYVITQSDPEEVKRFRRQFRLTLPFFFERVGTPGLRSYNVAWRPRAYLLDGQARLLYIQSRHEDSETARNKVVRLTERPMVGRMALSTARGRQRP